MRRRYSLSTGQISKISGQIHVIYSKSNNSLSTERDFKIRQAKTYSDISGIFLCWDSVNNNNNNNNTEQMQNVTAHKNDQGKARWHLHKYAMSFYEHMREEARNKIASV